MQQGRTDTQIIELGHLTIQPLEQELFPEEIEALSTLKQNKISNFFPDRFLMGCLFAKKLNIERTIQLLHNNLNWRLHNGYEKIPEWNDIPKKGYENNIFCCIPGARSRNGSPIYYVRSGMMIPSDFGNDYVNKILTFQIWWNSIGTFVEGMDWHRNGVTIVMDMTGVGWKNFDFSLQKKMNGAIQENFPQRVDKILVVNPPKIFNAVMSISRLFVKKKIFEKISAIQKDQLTEFIDPDQMWSEFGGNIEYSGVQLVEEINNRLQAEPIHFHTIAKKEKLASSRKVKKNKKKFVLEEQDLDNLLEDVPEDVKQQIKREVVPEEFVEDVRDEDILDVSEENKD